MDSITKISSETKFTATVLLLMVLMIAAVQVADTPKLEATTAAIILCYKIDDAGRIIDDEGRVRGWMRGSAVYGPNLELKYRLEGRRLVSVK